MSSNQTETRIFFWLTIHRNNYVTSTKFALNSGYKTYEVVSFIVFVFIVY